MAFLMIVHVPYDKETQKHPLHIEDSKEGSINDKLSPVAEEDSPECEKKDDIKESIDTTETKSTENLENPLEMNNEENGDNGKQDESNSTDKEGNKNLKDEEGTDGAASEQVSVEDIPPEKNVSEVKEQSPNTVSGDDKLFDDADINHVSSSKTNDGTVTEVTDPSCVSARKKYFKCPNFLSETDIANTKDTEVPQASNDNSPDSSSLVSPTTPKDAIPFLDKIPLHQEVEGILLKDGNVKNLEKSIVGNGSCMRFSFVEEDSKNCENILNMLKSIGVGFAADTSVSVFPCSVHESGSAEIKSVTSDKSLEEVEDREESTQDTQKESVFKKSIKSRLVVAQVVASVRNNALFTFDYLLLLLLASVIACVGLAENSSVVLVASMLISPLMGPILASTFGQIVKMKDLRNLGFRSELVGLTLCLLVGFVFGLITGGFGLQGAIWGSSDQWPTPEMKSRGLLRSLGIGILIALPSGAGVAISVLSANTGSLVGVAISASLLPPACNAGMLWGYSLLAAISPPAVMMTGVPTTIAASTTTIVSPSIAALVNNVTNSSLTDDTSNTTTIPITTVFQPYIDATRCPTLVNNAYTPVYSCKLAIDAALLGLVSLFLTILNIICIFGIGLFFLWIKEVAPHTAGKEKSTDHFWHEDIKVARTYYQTSKGAHSNRLGKQFLDEWKKIKHANVQTGQENNRKDSMVERAETMEMCQHLMGVQNSPDMQKVLSKLHTPTTNLMDDLLQEYDEAKIRLEEQIVNHPTFMFANTQVQSRDKTFMRAYNTLSAAAPKDEKPSIFEMRNRFRRMGGVQSMYINMEDETGPNVAFLSKPGDSLLGRKRHQKKEKAVKFHVEKVDEVEEPLIP